MDTVGLAVAADPENDAWASGGGGVVRVSRAWMKSRGLEARHNFVTIARVPGEPPGASYLDVLVEGLGQR